MPRHCTVLHSQASLTLTLNQGLQQAHREPEAYLLSPVLLLFVAHDAQLCSQACVLCPILPKLIQQQICVVWPQPVQYGPYNLMGLHLVLIQERAHFWHLQEALPEYAGCALYLSCWRMFTGLAQHLWRLRSYS